MKKNKNRKIFCQVIVFCIILVALIGIELWSAINHNLLIYSSQQEQQIGVMFSSCLAIVRGHEGEGSFKDTIISNIQDNFPTSSSVYCFVAVNDKMLFIKDQSSTRQLLNNCEMKVEQYLNQKGKPPVPLDSPAAKTVRTVLENAKYYVSMDSITYGDDVITLGICTKMNYIIKRDRFDILLLHLGTYIALCVIAFISSTYFLLNEIKSKNIKIQELETEVTNNRQLLDQLHEEVWEVTSSDISINLYGFFPKEVVEKVLLNLTLEQAKLTRKIYLRLNSSSKETFINIAALLERFYMIKNVSCFWNENEFLVLLLNASDKEAELFEKYIRRQYQIRYSSSIDRVIFDIEPIETEEVVK
jgi:hypothetical protein